MLRDNDLELIRGVADGDRRAFERFYDRYRSRLARFISRLTWRNDVVEEVINDTMVVVWQRADSFRGGSRVSTWVLGIAYRTTLKHLRRLARRPEEELTDAAMPADLERPDTALFRRQGNERIRLALDKLSPEHRTVVELTFFNDCSYQEIAEIVGCPENTVKTRMFHARRRLKRLLRTPEIGLVATRRQNDDAT